MNKIVIEFHPEDRARLDAIIAGLEKLRPNCDSCVDNVLRVVEGARDEKPAAAPEKDPQPVTPAPAPVPDVPEVPAAEPPSLADFQKAVAMRCASNPAIKPKVRELVNRFAESVSEIPAEKRLEFLDLLAKV